VPASAAAAGAADARSRRASSAGARASACRAVAGARFSPSWPSTAAAACVAFGGPGVIARAAQRVAFGPLVPARPGAIAERRGRERPHRAPNDALIATGHMWFPASSGRPEQLGPLPPPPRIHSNDPYGTSMGHVRCSPK
jgi:hypothetical protein